MKSLKGLARRLCVPLEELQLLADNVKAQYRSFPRPKKSGKVRWISAPSERLKSVQRRIYSVLLKPYVLPAYVHGCAPGKTPCSNAEAHVAQRALVRIDLESFFPSVTPRHVYRVWVGPIDCSPQVASLLTRLTTHDFELPQGSPASPALANLVLRHVDQGIAGLARDEEMVFTRFVDDIGLSGRDPERLIPTVAGLIQREGFRVSREKVAVMPRGRRQQMTGYGTNGTEPSIGKGQRSRIRAAIHHLGQMEPSSPRYEKKWRSIQGRIRYVSATNPGAARRLERYLERAAPHTPDR